MLTPVGKDRPRPWNKRLLVGQKKPLQPKHGRSEMTAPSRAAIFDMTRLTMSATVPRARP